MMRQTLSWFRPPPVSKSLTTDILSDYATLMIGILKDNARPEAGAVYGAIEMDWAKLVGQIAQANAK
jgi:hypothetical protein